MSDLHSRHFGAVTILLAYISHKVLLRVRGHLQSTLLGSLGLPSAPRTVSVSTQTTVRTFGNEAFAVRPWAGLY